MNIGMNRHTGNSLSGTEHIRQSIIDILTTPIGTRVMRRDYGSRLFQLLDAPIAQGTLVEIYAATAEALAKWEPRIQLNRVQGTLVSAGSIELRLDVLIIETQTNLQLTISL